MIVCHCHRINHRRVLEVIQAGARTPAEVGRACGAGTNCGGCVATVCELIEDSEHDRRAEASGVHGPAEAYACAG